MNSSSRITQDISIPKMDEPDFKVLENQLSYEAMMNKKYNQYALYFKDAQLKNLCRQAAQKHKKNYKLLLDYLNSHQ